MAHFLKRLELNGFKSFAGKTVLDFPPGITAVVGPNGSGKSNVVDAIRWLLGEREAKNLRGAKVEDLIFAGTSKRPRVGRAQASLHFENSNKFFPVDFEEVSILRQVSRDGASQYFLNKSEILLRDLIDFFARARLGSRGLIVVTQGNSDIFIQTDPQGRREMIEEILGLREYQIKKADALRRLKNSRINLDKVRALTEEILPHLRSLKRQTARWEKRGALEDELRAFENIFFGSQFLDIDKNLAELEKKISVAEDKLRKFEDERAVAEARQAEVEASQPEARKDLQKIKEQTQGLLEKRSELQKELGRIEAQIEISAKNDEAVPGKFSLSKALDLVNRIKNKLSFVLGKGTDDLVLGVKNVIAEIDGFLAEGGAKKDAFFGAGLKQQFDKVNQDLKSLEEEMLSLKNRERELDKTQQEFYAAFKSAVGVVETAKKNIENWQFSNKENLFAKERLNLRREELSRQIAQTGRMPREFENWKEKGGGAVDLGETERRIFKLRGDLASIGEIDEALMKEAAETETRYEFLKKESSDLESAIADLKKLIADLREKLKTEFDSALLKINDEFGKFFNLMFDGGHARLKVLKREIPIAKTVENEAVEDEDVSDRDKAAEEPEEEGSDEGGLEIELKLPRKKINSLEMLSGGERSLVGVAALFALISVSPPPFLVLDEIDAALDERNARRFAEMLKDFSKKTQFVVVTHNRATMEAADVLYGVTLSDDGTSKILSLKLGA